MSAPAPYRTPGSVYALCTPQGTPFYVGSTVQSPGTRAGQHLRDARVGRYPSSQVHQLLASAGRVGVWVLERGVPRDRLGARERHHQAELEAAGFAMLNYQTAGNGRCSQPQRIRDRISRYARKRPRGPKGEFLPVLPPIAGAAPTDAEQFMAGTLELPF